MIVEKSCVTECENYLNQWMQEKVGFTYSTIISFLNIYPHLNTTLQKEDREGITWKEKEMSVKENIISHK